MNSALRYGKAGLTWGVLVSTIAWSMGLAALLTPLATQAVASGDLIKASTAAVYYYGEDGKRYVFPNQPTYNTWYSDFSGVVVITDAELAAIPIGGNVTYKPGVRMVKITTDPKVYVVDAGGTLRPIASEAEATTLYGSAWNTMIDDVADSFFTNYTVGGAAAGFDKAAATAAATSINDDKNLSSGGNTGGGSVTVSLAADTPATGVIPASAARVPFTKFTLTNNTSLDAVVDQMVMQRMGLAQDGEFSSVDILDENMDPINQFSKTFNSDHQASVNDDVTVPANSSRSFYLAGNMASSLTSYAGELPVLALASLTLKGGGSVSGTLPVAGNHQVINGTITIGTATVATGGNNPSATTQNVGEENYIVTSFKVTAGSAEDLMLKYVTFTNNGSSSPEDAQNLELVNLSTGTVIDSKATVESDKIKMAIMEPLEKGKNTTYDLRLDVANGSGRDISYDIDQQADLVVSGDLYGYNVLPTYPASATPFFNANNTTIGDGTLRFESVSLDGSSIAEGLDQVEIGKFKAVAKGEPINITSMGWNFTITTTTGSTADITDITNVTVYDPNGSVIVSALDPSVNKNNATTEGSDEKGTATSSDTITVPTGETVYTVKADLSSDFTANDTVRAGVEAGAITAKGDISGNSVTPTPTGSNTQSTSLTVKAASLAVSISSNPAAQTVVAGVNDFHVADLVLDASASGDDIRVTSIKLALHETASAFPNQFTSFKLYDGSLSGTQVPVNADNLACTTAGCSTAGDSATTTLTITAGDLTVEKGKVKVVPVTVNVGTGSTSGTFSVGVSHAAAAPGVAGLDSDNQAITPSFTASDGQTMTLAAGGTLNVTVGTEPDSALTIGGSSAIPVGEVNLESLYDGVTFPDGFGFTVQAPDGGIVGDEGEIATISLWDGATELGSTTCCTGHNSANATITTPGFELDIDTTKKLTWKATFNSVQTGSSAVAGAGVKIALTNIDANAKVGSSVTQSSIESATFSDFNVFKSLPIVAKQTVAAGGLVNGVNTLYKFSVTADSAGSERGIGVYKFTFGINTSGVGLTEGGYTLYEGSSEGALTNIIATGSDLVVTNSVDGSDFVILEAFLDVGNNYTSTPGKEQRVIGDGDTKHYTLQGTINSVCANTACAVDATAGNESIQTTMAGDSGYAGTGALRADATGHASDTGVNGVDRFDDFIWSDLNLSNYNSSTATNATMFFNGYRVSGLENTTSTVSAADDS